MQIGQPSSTLTYRLFLSSGDDALALRDRVESLVQKVITPQLREAEFKLRIEIDRWEQTASQKTPGGQSTNDRFVARAASAHLTLALLLDRLGQGTREEIEAALASGTEVSALWFIGRAENADSEVASFLGDERENLLHERTGKPDSDESWHGILKILFALVLEGLKAERGPHFEER
jgi:hypothetical protein